MNRTSVVALSILLQNELEGLQQELFFVGLPTNIISVLLYSWQRQAWSIKMKIEEIEKKYVRFLCSWEEDGMWQHLFYVYVLYNVISSSNHAPVPNML